MLGYDFLFDCYDGYFECDSLIGTFFSILAEMIGPIILIVGSILAIVFRYLGYKNKDVLSRGNFWSFTVIVSFVILIAFLFFLWFLACALSGGNYFGCGIFW